MSMPRSIVAAVLSASLAHGGNVLVVSAGGSGAFTEIQPAINASADGDVVLVRTGSYSGFLIGDRSIAIVGDASSSVTILGTGRVDGLSASKAVLLSNFTAIGPSGASILNRSALQLVNSPGHIRVQSCILQGGPPSPGFSADGVFADLASDLALSACTLLGGSGWSAGSAGANGLWARQSHVTVHDSMVEGGPGAPSNVCYVSGGGGGDGLLARATTLLTARSSIAGGRGGMLPGCSAIFGCAHGGDGGDGIVLESYPTPSLASLLGVMAQGGGPGGLGSNDCGSCCDEGFWGLPRVGNTFVDLAGLPRSMSAPTVARELTPMSLQLFGQPGDRVAMLAAPRPVRPDVSRRWTGFLAVEAGVETRMVPIGVVPASGVLQATIDVPALAPTEQARIVFLQGAFRDTQGGWHLSSPGFLVILDQAF